MWGDGMCGGVRCVWGVVYVGEWVRGGIRCGGEGACGGVGCGENG